MYQHANLLRNIRSKITDLTDWIKVTKEELSRPQAPSLADLYQDTKPIYDEWKGIRWKGIRWKGKREKFELENERDLKTFRMARRKLEKYLSSDGEIPIQTWHRELAALQQKYQAEYEQYRPIRDDLWKLQQVKRCTDIALHQQEQTRQKRQKMR